MSTVLDVDARKRVTLGSAVTAERYVMDVAEDGVITLSPAEVLTRDEIKLLQRPEIMAAIDKSRAEEAAGLPSGPRPKRSTGR